MVLLTTFFLLRGKPWARRLLIWVTLGVLALALAVLVGVIVINLSNAPTTAGGSEALVRPDSHRLSTAADGKTTVVEFLDFECESCLAAYPGVEKLRAEYGDKITYVVRYFPIASQFEAGSPRNQLFHAGRLPAWPL